MLPAFPKIEKLTGEVHRQTIENLAAQKSPMLAMITKHILFEGRQTTIHRHDDSVGDSPLQAVSAEIKLDEMTIENFLESGFSSLFLTWLGSLPPT